MIFNHRLLVAGLFAATLAGCASDGSGPFATGSVTPAPAAETAKADPACAALSTQIATLRKEGTIDRLEKVATGKGPTVQVQRAALAKQAELNKANADFQTKCSTAQARNALPAAAPATETAAIAAPAAAKAAKTAAAKATEGVTVAPSKTQ
jgi:hypothetical protein